MKTKVTLQLTLPCEIEFDYSETEGVVTDVNRIKVTFEGRTPQDITKVYDAMCEVEREYVAEELKDKFERDEYES